MMHDMLANLSALLLFRLHKSMRGAAGSSREHTIQRLHPHLEGAQQMHKNGSVCCIATAQLSVQALKSMSINSTAHDVLMFPLSCPRCTASLGDM